MLLNPCTQNISSCKRLWITLPVSPASQVILSTCKTKLTGKVRSINKYKSIFKAKARLPRRKTLPSEQY